MCADISVADGLADLARAKAPLDPLLPYLADGQLPVSSLIGSIEASSLPLVYEALLDLGRRKSQPEITAQVEEIMGLERERRAMQARETVDEVSPVLEVSSRY